jgi:hypothetical protein
MNIGTLLLALLVLALTVSEKGSAQGSAGTNSNVEPRFIVDMPTAGILRTGTFAFDTDVYGEGGLLCSLTAGFLTRASFGLSYGGSRLIGAGSPVMNVVPGFSIKVRLIDENVVLPAIALGFDTQGRDGYLKELDRYAIKSPGLYAAASKNYAMLGFLSFHGGINYTLERADGDKDLNFFFGMEKSVGPIISASLEYNAGFNDNSAAAIGHSRGYLSAAVAWSFGGGLTIVVGLKDLLHNGSDVSVVNRTLRFEFARSF